MSRPAEFAQAEVPVGDQGAHPEILAQIGRAERGVRASLRRGHLQQTGLVWERFVTGGAGAWNTVINGCLVSTTGGRRGWRLPTIYELVSLMDLDPSLRASTGLILPVGQRPVAMSAAMIGTGTRRTAPRTRPV